MRKQEKRSHLNLLVPGSTAEWSWSGSEFYLHVDLIERHRALYPTKVGIY